MSNVVSLCAYRAAQDRAVPQPIPEAPAADDRLAVAQDSLAQASHALHEIRGCLDEVARRLGRADPAVRDRGHQRVVHALEKLHQCRVDTAELTRLIEAGDIDGCERLRASIQARGEG